MGAHADARHAVGNGWGEWVGGAMLRGDVWFKMGRGGAAVAVAVVGPRGR